MLILPTTPKAAARGHWHASPKKRYDWAVFCFWSEQDGDLTPLFRR